jgi:tRNA pseudouridine13 synthase
VDKPRARIKTVPEDFVVEEIPAYEPSGAGEHLYVRFTKRGLTTDEAVRAICAAVGADARAAGVAGMKDKHAVTTQTISIHTPKNPEAVDVAGVTVHAMSRHGNKIKPGHLIGNRFRLLLRGVARERAGEVVASLERAGREGVPNAFGAQRFGARGDNVERARAWLAGKERGPRDPKARRFMFSSMQSAAFNALLEKRVDDGTWATPLEGDLVKQRTHGGLFLCTDVQTDRERAARGEVSPTGPIPGVKMRAPEGVPRALEEAAIERVFGAGFDFAATRALGEGTRRALRLWVDDLEAGVDPAGAEEQDASVRVYFVLPKGAYATTVLASAVELEMERTVPND